MGRGYGSLLDGWGNFNLTVGNVVSSNLLIDVFSLVSEQDSHIILIHVCQDVDNKNSQTSSHNPLLD